MEYFSYFLMAAGTVLAIALIVAALGVVQAATLQFCFQPGSSAIFALAPCSRERRAV